MKVVSGLVGISAMVAAALPFSLSAHADDQGASLPTKAPSEWKTVGGIVYSGEIEAGGLGFIDRPPNTSRTSLNPCPGGISPCATVLPAATGNPQGWAYTQPESRAKFEEYGNINPGFWFDHLKFDAATTDGRYFTDFYATHIGNNDQSYYLQLGETGRQYLTLQWYQTPNLYSTTAQSIFGGTSNFLTAPDLSGAGNCGVIAGTPAPAGAAATTAAQNCLNAINRNLHTINLGIQRDTGTIEYRSTPTESTELTVEYSHEKRWGTQETGVTSGNPTSATVGPSATNMQVPMPISDTTQEARASLQYNGTSPWGLKFTSNVQYYASIYNNDLASFDVQNPFITSAFGNATPGYLNQISLAPSNNAQMFTGTVGADLPMKNRYMGTFSYTMMRQNDSFMAPTSSSNILSYGGAIVPTASLPGLTPSRGSLDGAVNTMLFNNVLTTQITPDVKSKLSYRYYNYDNATPFFNMPQWVVGDSQLACTAGASYCPHSTQFSSYTKQNAGEELTWRANSWFTTGIAYGWQHYNYTLANVSSTNENSGKIFADARPTDWWNLRTSYEYSARRYQNYNYLNNVWVNITDWTATCTPNSTAVNNIAAPGGYCANTGGIQINPLMRIFDLANRDQQKANVYLDFDIAQGIVVTPTFGMQLNRYPDGPINTVGNPTPTTMNTFGLRTDNNFSAGVDLSMQLNSATKLTAGYMYEVINRRFIGGGGYTGQTPPGGFVTAISNPSNYDNYLVNDYVNTVSAVMNIELKPQVLDLRLGYNFSYATETGAGLTCAGSGAVPGGATGFCSSAATFIGANSVPNVTNTYQLFDAVLKYKFDQDQLRAMGWNGQGYLKLRYVYEMNHVANWQSDNMMPYMFVVAPTATGAGNKVYLAGDNPNYNAQFVMATLGLSW